MVVSDAKLIVSSDNVIDVTDILTPEIVSATDYYPFGMPMPGRSFNSGDYRFGFNGKEKVDEISGSGNSYDFGARIYDPRLGKWLSTDPLQAKYPALSPYSFCVNNPIYYVDPDGNKIVVHYRDDRGRSHRVVIRKVADIEKLKEAQGFGQDMYKTLTYLKDDEHLQEAISLRTAVHTREVMGGDFVAFVPKENTDQSTGESYQHQIYFEAYDPLNLKDNDGNFTGEYQSPALGFLHEIGHFLNRIKNGAKQHAINSEIKKNPDGSYVDPIYHSPEEKNVIINVENPFAKKHGEPLRTNHKGDIGKPVENPSQHSSQTEGAGHNTRGDGGNNDNSNLPRTIPTE